ncbi:MAG: tRNA lysidine(34) synthetase TilS [bacterium]
MKKQDLLGLVRAKLLSVGIGRGDRLLVAVSGGPDSMALLDILGSLADEMELELTTAHIDHGLRKRSGADAKLVHDYCRAHAIDYVLERVDVKGELNRRGGGVEEVARELRYAALRRIAKGLQADWIITAHHRDDQIETIVFNFLRGSGIRGLGGMREANEGILRPLLGVSKEELLRFAQRRRIKFGIDVTNTDTNLTRNRIRHKLMPVLRRFNPNLEEVWLRNSYIFQQADIALRELAVIYLGLMGRAQSGKVSVSISRLRELAPLMQIEVLKLAISQVVGGVQGLKHIHFEELLGLLASPKKSVSKRFPSKLLVVCAHDKITISRIG